MTAADPSPVDMPGAKCGRTTGLYRCVRKAGHGGNCQMQRRTDVDLGEDLDQVAPPDVDGERSGGVWLPNLVARDLPEASLMHSRVQTMGDVGGGARPSSTMRPSSTPYALADQLEVAARALRLSGSKQLVDVERDHARAIAVSVVGRVADRLTPKSSGLDFRSRPDPT